MTLSRTADTSRRRGRTPRTGHTSAARSCGQLSRQPGPSARSLLSIQIVLRSRRQAGDDVAGEGPHEVYGHDAVVLAGAIAELGGDVVGIEQDAADCLAAGDGAGGAAAPREVEPSPAKESDAGDDVVWPEADLLLAAGPPVFGVGGWQLEVPGAAVIGQPDGELERPDAVPSPGVGVGFIAEAVAEHDEDVAGDVVLVPAGRPGQAGDLAGEPAGSLGPYDVGFHGGRIDPGGELEGGGEEVGTAG